MSLRESVMLQMPACAGHGRQAAAGFLGVHARELSARLGRAGTFLRPAAGPIELRTGAAVPGRTHPGAQAGVGHGERVLLHDQALAGASGPGDHRPLHAPVCRVRHRQACAASTWRACEARWTPCFRPP